MPIRRLPDPLMAGRLFQSADISELEEGLTAGIDRRGRVPCRGAPENRRAPGDCPPEAD